MGVVGRVRPTLQEGRIRPKARPKGVGAVWSDEETHDPLYADDRNFYTVEKWTRDGSKVDSLLYASNNLEKARDICARAIKHRPRIRLTIRQRSRVPQQYSI